MMYTCYVYVCKLCTIINCANSSDFHLTHLGRGSGTQKIRPGLAGLDVDLLVMDGEDYGCREKSLV